MNQRVLDELGYYLLAGAGGQGPATLVDEARRGEELGFGTAFGRLLLLWLDFAICYIGVLWPIWDKDRQCLLSDKLTKAVVYKD